MFASLAPDLIIQKLNACFSSICNFRGGRVVLSVLALGLVSCAGGESSVAPNERITKDNAAQVSDLLQYSLSNSAVGFTGSSVKKPYVGPGSYLGGFPSGGLQGLEALGCYYSSSNNVIDADGDGIPSNVSYVFSCSDADLAIEVNARDTDDRDPSSGFVVARNWSSKGYGGIGVSSESLNSLEKIDTAYSVRSFFDMTWDFGDYQQAINYDWLFSYIPDSAQQPTKGGDINLSGTLDIKLGGTGPLSTYNFSGIKIISSGLHLSPSCPQGFAGFNAGKISIKDGGNSTLEITYNDRCASSVKLNGAPLR